MEDDNPIIILYPRKLISLCTQLFVFHDKYQRTEKETCKSHPSIKREQEELKYWDLPEELLEPCCLLNYFPNTARFNFKRDKYQKDLILKISLHQRKAGEGGRATVGKIPGESVLVMLAIFKRRVV